MAFISENVPALSQFSANKEFFKLIQRLPVVARAPDVVVKVCAGVRRPDLGSGKANASPRDPPREPLPVAPPNLPEARKTKPTTTPKLSKTPSP